MIDTEQNVANVVWHMVHENGDKSVVVSSGGKACIDYTCTQLISNLSVVIVDSTDGSGNLECMALAAHSSRLSPERQS